jgi:hypothetical protein
LSAALALIALALALQLAPAAALPAALALIALALALQLAPASALPAALAQSLSLAALTLRPTLAPGFLAATFAASLLFLGVISLALREDDPRVVQRPGFGLNSARRGGNPHRRTYKEYCVSSAYNGHFLAFRWNGHSKKLRPALIKSRVASF